MSSLNEKMIMTRDLEHANDDTNRKLQGAHTDIRNLQASKDGLNVASDEITKANGIIVERGNHIRTITTQLQSLQAVVNNTSNTSASRIEQVDTV